MSPEKEQQDPKAEEEREEDSLAERALEAIVRSQQLRARARKLRDGGPNSEPREDKAP